MEVGVRFVAAHFFDSSFDADLPVQVRPVEDERGARVVAELPAFARRVVRVERESFGTELLQKNDAGGDVAAFAGRRESHRRGVEPWPG